MTINIIIIQRTATVCA